MSCGVGCRRGLDSVLLWLWHRPVATAPIRPLAWEPPYAVGTGQEMAKRLKKKKKKKKGTNVQKQLVNKNVLTAILEKDCKQMYLWVTVEDLPNGTEIGKTDYSPASVKYIGNNT